MTDGPVKLRKFTAADKTRLVELANNEKISINLRDSFPHPYTESRAKEYLEFSIGQNPTLTFAIEYNGLYVGNIGFKMGHDVYRKSAEIICFLGEEYWNQGIMTRAVNLICEYGFKELDLVRIYAQVFEYNTASMKVLEKTGFKKEAIFRKAVMKNGKIYDEYVYAKIIEE